MYFQPEENHKTRIAKSEKVKHYRFKHELEISFLFNFLCQTEEVETSGKNGAAIGHTWQLQEKI